MRWALRTLSLGACLMLLSGTLTPLSAKAATALPEEAAVSAPQENSCGEVLVLLRQQNQDLARDMRRLHRELAALRHELEQPGLKEIFSGIGYIFGLCGVAFFFLGRKSRAEDGG
ncbi:nickel transport protein [Geoalkalibacter ferrihydriticus]|uniref:Nickel transport protein n=2 Tax=Geoalkalibacter ferrihydriticus TaxID=392333 RepID=A0A0C2ECJ5_9BACT|nr:hypothetical protein [Geoalkalibacter ferrihydriticus]KIH76313.1 hypothetical protein GFER_11955 [Geoalkalibacter ferrihydriticus DSM 17813]SDL21358.1 nickel transport protein [Geoalkalibacter ferrihydriticus]